MFRACFEEQPEALLLGSAAALHPDNNCPLDMRIQCLKGACEQILSCSQSESSTIIIDDCLLRQITEQQDIYCYASWQPAVYMIFGNFIMIYITQSAIQRDSVKEPGIKHQACTALMHAQPWSMSQQSRATLRTATAPARMAVTAALTWRMAMHFDGPWLQ